MENSKRLLLGHGQYQNVQVNDTAWIFSCTICVNPWDDELCYLVKITRVKFMEAQGASNPIPVCSLLYFSADICGNPNCFLKLPCFDKIQLRDELYTTPGELYSSYAWRALGLKSMPSEKNRLDLLMRYVGTFLPATMQVKHAVNTWARAISSFLKHCLITFIYSPLLRCARICPTCLDPDSSELR